MLFTLSIQCLFSFNVVYLMCFGFNSFRDYDLENGFPREIRNWKIKAKFGGAAGQTDATAAGSGRMQVKQRSQCI